MATPARALKKWTECARTLVPAGGESFCTQARPTLWAICTSPRCSSQTCRSLHVCAITIFGLVEAALIKPLPYRDQSRLIGAFEVPLSLKGERELQSVSVWSGT